MEGTRVSHYEVLELLGGGGMGVVYKALDARLNRHVALKFLPPELTRDEDARQRFVQEAQAASALDHPNICTIHEIDSTPEGQMFIAMALYDGETLKKRIEHGPVPVAEALDIAIQIARGLREAHEAGIVHRDVKPANMMLTKHGLVKIVDFGIAKLAGVTGITKTSSTLGTLAYMSPEQVDGQEADERSDVWSLGAVFYEMLTGQQPFKGENQWAVIHAIGSRDPDSPSAVREGIPSEVDDLVLRSLRRSREARFASVETFLETAIASQAGLESTVSGRTPPRPSPVRALRNPRVVVPAGAIVAVAVVGAIWAWSTVSEVRWARQAALPEIERLLDEEGNFLAAYALAEEVEEVIPEDPVLRDLWPELSTPVSISTSPDGADVYFREYDDAEAGWELVGRTPLVDVRLPQGVFEWRIEREGFASLHLAAANPGEQLGNLPWENPLSPLRDVALVPDDAVLPDMVFVPGGSLAVPLTGFGFDLVALDPFLIDTHEVTNEEFKEFVDAGGYERPEFWVGLRFERDGGTLSWEEATAGFVDATSRPGPSTWELGDYPDGEADHPVGGVSWYEAAAYAAFRGRSLPTLYHWARAANSFDVQPAIVPRSNFDGAGPAPVGSYGGLGPYGAFDMAGNVREWVWNASGTERWSLGGAWSDRPYMAAFRHSLPPFDRSPLNGFRTVRYLREGPLPGRLTDPRPITRSDHREDAPISPEVFNSFVPQLAYQPSPLDAATEWTDDADRSYVRQRISFEAGYAGERTPLHLFLPKTGSAPFAVLVYFPGLEAFDNPGHSDAGMLVFPGPERFAWKSGVALAWPVYDESYERWDGNLSGLSGPELRRAQIERLAHWREDLGRTIDYLETREDLDTDRLGYLGFSFGASSALPLLALEERFRVAVLVSGGVGGSRSNPVTYSMNYLPRITLPVLMLNGAYDHIFPVDTDQDPLFERLGTPEADKRHRVYEAGHWPLPRSEWIPEALTWLDRYIGLID